MEKHKIFYFAWIAAFCLLFCASSFADIPRTITVQGKLTGITVPDGNKLMTFIVNNINPANSFSQDVQAQVKNNIFSATISVPQNIINFDGFTSVGVKVDNTVFPNQELTSVPYALQAENANKLGGIAAADFVTQNQLAQGGLTQAVADDLYVNVAGDTMTGNLVVEGNVQAKAITGTKITGKHLGLLSKGFGIMGIKSTLDVAPDANLNASVYGLTGNNQDTYAGYFSGGLGLYVKGPANIFQNLTVGGNITAQNINALGNITINGQPIQGGAGGLNINDVLAQTNPLYVKKIGDSMAGTLTVNAASGVIGVGAAVDGKSGLGVLGQSINPAGQRGIGVCGLKGQGFNLETLNGLNTAVLGMTDDMNAYSGYFTGGKGIIVVGNTNIIQNLTVGGSITSTQGITTAQKVTAGGLLINGNGIITGNLEVNGNITKNGNPIGGGGLGIDEILAQTSALYVKKLGDSMVGALSVSPTNAGDHAVTGAITAGGVGNAIQGIVKAGNGYAGYFEGGLGVNIDRNLSVGGDASARNLIVDGNVNANNITAAQNLSGNALNVNSGTVVGNLQVVTLNGRDPDNLMEGLNRVDADGLYVNVTGDNMTGPLVLRTAENSLKATTTNLNIDIPAIRGLKGGNANRQILGEIGTMKDIKTVENGRDVKDQRYNIGAYGQSDNAGIYGKSNILGGGFWGLVTGVSAIGLSADNKSGIGVAAVGGEFGGRFYSQNGMGLLAKTSSNADLVYAIKGERGNNGATYGEVATKNVGGSGKPEEIAFYGIASGTAVYGQGSQFGVLGVVDNAEAVDGDKIAVKGDATQAPNNTAYSGYFIGGKGVKINNLLVLTPRVNLPPNPEEGTVCVQIIDNQKILKIRLNGAWKTVQVQ